MTPSLRFITTLLSLTLLGAAQAQPADTNQARSSAMALGKSLQTELMAATQEGGPLAAISVCNTRAMPIAKQISQEQGWEVGRTSTKIRNPHNQADTWELEQLNHFAERAKSGEPLDSMEVMATIQQDGKTMQRYMKAIGVQPGCLACHGNDIAPEVKAKLSQLYPTDQATGYQVGQLRGAFTLQREVKKP